MLGRPPLTHKHPPTHPPALPASGEVSPREGVLELMSAAKAAGLPYAVCSASTKEAVTVVVPAMLGGELFSSLALFLAGDDVAAKKPDPTIYRVGGWVGARGGRGVREGSLCVFLGAHNDSAHHSLTHAPPTHPHPRPGGRRAPGRRPRALPGDRGFDDRAGGRTRRGHALRRHLHVIHRRPGARARARVCVCGWG